MGRYKFHPRLQLPNLHELQALGYIVGFKSEIGIWRNYTFAFNLTQQDIGGEKVEMDFSKYKIRIEYYTTLPPKIFIVEPKIEKGIHRYKDGSLCLYHPSNFKWGDNMSISHDLLPWVYMWIYYYEMWLKTGKWFGEEYQH